MSAKHQSAFTKAVGTGLSALEAAATQSISDEARRVCSSKKHRDLIEEFLLREGDDGKCTKSAPTEDRLQIKEGKGIFVKHPLGVGSIVTVAGFNVPWRVLEVTAETAGRGEHATVSETRYV